MKNIALLPDGHWPPAGTGGAIAFTDEKVLNNLVKADVLTAGGVSNAWSAALAFEWRLELLDPGADQLLEMLLLARYLDLLEVRTLQLTPGADASLLQRVLKESLEHGGTPVELTLFEWRTPPDGNPKLLAAGLRGRWPIFPSAHYQSANGVKAIRGQLARLGHDVIRFEDGRATFLEERDGLAFRAQLAALAGRVQGVQAKSPWSGRLRHLSRDTPPARGADIDALIYPRAHGTIEDLWRCPNHGDIPWARDPGVPTVHVSHQTQTLTCGRHHCPLEWQGRQLTIEDLGVAVVHSASGVAELVVWDDDAATPNLRRADVSGNAVTIAYAHGPRFKLDARCLRLEDVLCTPVPFLDGDFACSLPVKASFADLLEDHEWIAAQRQWRVRFKGRVDALLLDRPPSGRSGVETGFLVWPQQPVEGWRADVVVAACSGAELALVERDLTGRHRVGRYRPKGALLVDTHTGVAAFVALREAGHDRGLVPLARNPLRRSGVRRGHLALDFGTSNSLVCVSVSADEPLVFSEHGVRSVRNSAYVPVMGQDYLVELQGGLDVFHAAYEVPQPSPLLGTLLLKKQSAGTTDPQWSVIPRDPNLLKNFKEAPGTKLYANLKWQDATTADDDATQVYLERILVPAIYSLVQSEVSSVKVVASFPLAFELSRRTRFEQVLTTAMKSLASRTGIEVESIVLISESKAGVRAVPATPADYVVTLDMGGGTTDVAVVDRYGKVLAADSLRVGGRRFLQVLAAKRPDLLAQLARGMGVNDGRRLGLEADTLMETILHVGGTNRLMAHLPPDNDLSRRRAFAALLGGIIVVARRLLALSVGHTGNNRPSVNAYLLGQGWGLLDEDLTYGFSEKSFTLALREACSASFDVQVAGTGMAARERKQLVVDGAMKLLRAGQLARDPAPRSFVGMDLRLADGAVLSGAEQLGLQLPTLGTGDPGFGVVVDEIAAVMGSTVEDHRYALPAADDWLKQIPYGGTMSHRDRLVALGYSELESILGEGGDSLRWSPLVRFVSRPWTEFWVSSVR